MNKYYYRFPSECKEGRALRSFHHACQKADQEAEKYAKKVGALAYYNSQEAFAGGVSCVSFKDPKTVNVNIWRFVGERDNEKLFMPNVNDTVGKKPLEHGKKTPKNSANRVYSQKPATDENGQLWVTYIEISAVAVSSPKTDRTHAVTAERWRLALPVVPVKRFYDAVGADLSVVDGTDARKVQENVPVFFLFHDSYYIGLDYPVRNADFELIDLGEYQRKKNDMLWEQKNLH